METTLKVTGMNCGACVGHVTRALQSVSGVQSAQVDLATGQAKVQHNEDAEPEAMVEAVVEEGFGAQLNPAS
jgi:copper chaperone CopZ